MKQSIITGGPLPETFEEFQRARDKMRYTECLVCGKAFTNKTVFSPPGWRETQITGWCEVCFDEFFDEFFEEEDEE